MTQIAFWKEHENFIRRGVTWDDWEKPIDSAKLPQWLRVLPACELAARCGITLQQDQDGTVVGFDPFLADSYEGHRVALEELEDTVRWADYLDINGLLVFESPEEWVTGGAVDRSGPMEQFVHLVRAPEDPQRSSREHRRRLVEDVNEEWRRVTGRDTFDEWRSRIVALLSDGRARTFNAIVVEIADITADVAFTKAPEKALWSLVSESNVEHTIHAPIRFRARRDQR